MQREQEQEQELEEEKEGEEGEEGEEEEEVWENIDEDELLEDLQRQYDELFEREGVQQEKERKKFKSKEQAKNRKAMYAQKKNLKN